MSELPDRENLESLRDKPSITCILPVRQDSQLGDIENHARALKKVVVSAQRSLILANHSEISMVSSHALLESQERWKVISEFGELAESTKSFHDFKEICMTVASELLTNAFYNAPRDQENRPLQANRRAQVKLSRPVEVAFGQDDTHVWMKVTDPFGTFNRIPLLHNLLKSASGGEIQINMAENEGGGGIGLYLVFRWASQLLFHFQPGQATTVLVKLLKTRRYKIFESQRAILEIINS